MSASLIPRDSGTVKLPDSTCSLQRGKQYNVAQCMKTGIKFNTLKRSQLAPNMKARKGPSNVQERLWPQDEAMAQPQPYDIVIPLLGVQGSGKSSLINTLTNGTAGLTVGHDIDPCTQAVQAVPIAHPKSPSRRIILIDTPGLDSTTAPDSEILERIASWLKKSYQDGVKLAGVLYLCEISQTRDFLVARKNLDHFDKLCGDRATKNVLLITTKWSVPPSQSELNREAALQDPAHWGHLIRRGSRMRRLEDASPDCAWSVVNLSIADAFTFDTEKIKDDLKGMRDSLKKKKDGHRLITTLEELLVSQNVMALELKRSEELPIDDILWNQLVANDRRLRDTLYQIDVKVPLSQKLKAFFKFFVRLSKLSSPIPEAD
ncbi:hypothetical protein H0H92_008953 [Tricholoma furcatifolium]|nr:hypothetical protein H0H92_008953 [Tricholoma furcatifolium]